LNYWKQLTQVMKYFRVEEDSNARLPKNFITGFILIVAPYNAQVADLLTRLPDAHIGTVDKFQGQEAPIVIYSL